MTAPPKQETSLEECRRVCLVDRRTYRSWSHMLARCTNPHNHAYGRYGGRGITVYPTWWESFENFLRDMGERPAGKTLDRYPDNNGNYEPGNCRWATPAEQVATRRKAAKPGRPQKLSEEKRREIRARKGTATQEVLAAAKLQKMLA